MRGGAGGNLYREAPAAVPSESGQATPQTPKLHLLDSGVACYLLGIRSPDELRFHPLRGAIFESWVVSEIMKAHHNAGQQPQLSFFRDTHGLEVDVLIEHGADLTGVEVKSGATVPLEMFDPLKAVARLVPELITRIVLHGGSESWTASAGQALSYREIDRRDWTKK